MVFSKGIELDHITLTHILSTTMILTVGDRSFMKKTLHTISNYTIQQCNMQGGQVPSQKIRQCNKTTERTATTLKVRTVLISLVLLRPLVLDFCQEPRNFVLTICSIIIVMPKISSQIIRFTKYWHLLALDLFLLVSLCCY